jgi:hypothetical protein
MTKVLIKTDLALARFRLKWSIGVLVDRSANGRWLGEAEL